MAAAEAFLYLHLEDDKVLALSADDIRDFYHQFRVGPSRARRNTLNMSFVFSEIAHLSAAKQLDASAGPFFPSFSTLAMGDQAAVELAQTAHRVLAGRSRTFFDSELLFHCAPEPRSDYATGVCVDDVGGLEWRGILAHGLGLASVASQRFVRLNGEYERVGLSAHPGKAVRLWRHLGR